MINCKVTCNYLYRLIYIVMVVVVSVEIEACGLHFVVRSFRCVWGTIVCADSFLTGVELRSRSTVRPPCNSQGRYEARQLTWCWLAVAFPVPWHGS